MTEPFEQQGEHCNSWGIILRHYMHVKVCLHVAMTDLYQHTLINIVILIRQSNFSLSISLSLYIQILPLSMNKQQNYESIFSRKIIKNGGNLPPFDKMKRIPTKLTFPEQCHFSKIVHVISCTYNISLYYLNTR